MVSLFLGSVVLENDDVKGQAINSADENQLQNDNSLIESNNTDEADEAYEKDADVSDESNLLKIASSKFLKFINQLICFVIKSNFFSRFWQFHGKY